MSTGKLLRMSKKNDENSFKLKAAKFIADFGRSTKDFYIFSAFWLLVAFLAFLQDYVNSLLNGSSFYIYESAAYKLFWLLFIPFSIVFYTSFTRFINKGEEDSKAKTFTIIVLFSILISLVHLFIFALSLSGISQLIHADPWKLSWLIREKLSTRLYFALSIYSVFSYLVFRSSRNENLAETKSFHTVLPIKNGSKSVMVETESIKWIRSDGAYLVLHVDGKKHVIVKSLKNILEQLDPNQFRRIHKSTIVNLKMINALKSRLNGDYDVILKDGTELRLSRNYTKSLKGTLL